MLPRASRPTVNIITCRLSVGRLWTLPDGRPLFLRFTNFSGLQSLLTSCKPTLVIRLGVGKSKDWSNSQSAWLYSRAQLLVPPHEKSSTKVRSAGWCLASPRCSLLICESCPVSSLSKRLSVLIGRVLAPVNWMSKYLGKRNGISTNAMRQALLIYWSCTREYHPLQQRANCNYPMMNTNQWQNCSLSFLCVQCPDRFYLQKSLHRFMYNYRYNLLPFTSHHTI